ncbi:hypothetical protein E2C01_095994 [Portunus trituberculatus]|uniref:Uncharacterized protein n=1 Tax=Portunus trituberculatus TaxID=210409 RepID=A0A5B7K5R5_PORTR|nr:hypothetical protein [Portunus trituberculatus]
MREVVVFLSRYMSWVRGLKIEGIWVEEVPIPPRNVQQMLLYHCGHLAESVVFANCKTVVVVGPNVG